METGDIVRIVVEDGEVDEEDKNRNLGKLAEELLELYGEASSAYRSERYEFVERCLRVKDYDVNKALKLLLQVEKYVKELNHLIVKHNVEKCATVHQDGVITAVKTMDDFGRKVLLYRFGEWHPNKIDFDQLVSTALLSFIWIVGDSKVIQRNGIVIVADLSKLGIVHVRAASIKTLTQFARTINDSAPGKIKAIHVINHPRIFRPVFSLMKPFFKAKLGGRIRFHGYNTSSLQGFVKPEILPGSLGGKLEETEAIDLELIRRFVADRSYCSEMSRVGLPK